MAKKQKTSVPINFLVTVGMGLWATKTLVGNFTYDGMDIETENMMDWCKANDKRNVDWEAFWRNWMRNWWFKYGGKERAEKQGSARKETWIDTFGEEPENGEQGSSTESPKSPESDIPF